MPRDLYDVLEVSRDANSDELRLAYRKLALVWHPDKNATRQEEATVRFKEIQNAYEVLSDKNERAWYDSHREEILRGGSTHYAGADTGAPPAEEGINLWAYFSTSAFSGYGDSGQGFYGVYGKVFEEIAKNEMQAARRSGLDFTAPPSLGSFSSPYAAVSSFYSHWLNFSTVKEFLWAAEYNLATAPNRQVRRLMEAENAKKVRVMRKKFNEEVRALAAWCKKRDKRVMERALEQKKLQAVREKEEAKAHKERLARKKAEQAALYVEQDWAVNEGADKLTDEGWWGDGDGKKDAGDAPQQELYCVACGKSFKSEKQWKNHEKSRKHLERAAALKEALLQEEEEANHEASDEGASDDFDTASEREGDVSEARAGGEDDVSVARDDVSRGSGGEGGRGPVTDEEILAQLDAQEAEMNRRSMEDGVRNVRLGGGESEEENDDGSEVDKMGNESGESGSDAGENDGSDAGEDDGLGDLLRMHKQNGKEESRTEPAEENELEGRVSEGDEEDGLDDLLRLHMKQKRKEDETKGPGERSDPAEESGSGRGEDSGASDLDDEEGLGDLLRLHRAQNGPPQRKKAERGDARKEAQEEKDGVKGENTGSKNTEPGATEVSLEGGTVQEEGKGSDTESVELGSGETAAEDLKENTDGMEAPQRDTAKVKKARRAANRAKKEGAQTAEVAPEVTSMRGRKGKKGKGGKAAGVVAQMGCVTCGEEFDSRTQLFKHLTATGHAIPKR